MKEKIKKLSKKHKNNISIGLKKYYSKNIVSSEIRKKLSNAIKGKHHSEETKRKISNLQIGRNYEEKYGKKKAKEIRKKLSNAIKGKMPKNIKLLRKRRREVPHTEETKELIRKARLKQRFLNKDTKIEIKIEEFLKELHIPYEKHKAIMGVTQPDFFVMPNICIYCDGDYWHRLPLAINRDKKINEILKFAGYKVIRMWEKEINNMNIIKFEEIYNSF